MPTSDASTKVSKAGITTSASGERIIASSTRADGSVRKEIRVRPGYRPPEDVEVYKNRTAEAFKSKGSGGVPGAETVEKQENKSPAPNKNAKKRDARKRAAANAATESEKAETEKGTNALSEKPAVDNKNDINDEAKEAVDPEVTKEKEARKLAKKLRQARDLKDKKDKGDALLPEQFEKVIRINELIRQLEALGFDANGEKNSNDDTG